MLKIKVIKNEKLIIYKYNKFTFYFFISILIFYIMKFHVKVWKLKLKFIMHKNKNNSQKIL